MSFVLSLPEFLLAGGTEEEWRQAKENWDTGNQLPTSVAEEGDSHDGVDADEIMMPPPKEEATAAAAATMEPDESSGDQHPSSVATRLLGPTGVVSSTVGLLDDDDLLSPPNVTSSGGPDSDLVEFEIVIDGEVVGSTFLPKRTDGNEERVEELRRQARANALKQQRKRKFEERMGYDADATTATQQTPNDESILPLPPGMCTSCGLVQFKYKCPKCDTGSCSLACVTAHKARTSCTGIRSRSAYVPLSRMDERTLQNDVSFLTDVERMAGAAARDPTMKDQKGQLIVLPVTDNQKANDGPASLEPSNASLFSCTPKHLDAASYTLMAACTQYRNIKLMCMPVGMKMHTENTSRVFNLRSGPSSGNVSLTTRDSCIKWTVHLQFKHRALTSDGPQSDLKVIKRKVDERATWAELLDSILTPPPQRTLNQEPTTGDANSTKESKHDPKLHNISTALLRHQLAAFIHNSQPEPTTTSTDPHSDVATPASSALAGRYSHLRLLYPVPFQASNAPRFYSLQICHTLLHSLAFKVLIEHPVLLVVHHADIDRYTIESEPTAPTKEKGKTATGEANNKNQNRKRRKTEGEEDKQAQAQSSAVVDAAASPVDSAPTTPAVSGVSSRGVSGRGRPPSGRGRGGGGRGGRGGFDRGHHPHAPPPQFGVSKPAEPTPAPTPAANKPQTPPLFKRWG